MYRQIRRLFCIARAMAVRENGSAAVEFLLLVTLLALGSVAGAQSLALSLNNAYDQVAANFSNAITPNLSGASGSSGGGSGSGGGTGNSGGGRGPANGGNSGGHQGSGHQGSGQHGRH